MQDPTIKLAPIEEDDIEDDPSVTQSKEYLAQRKKYIDNYIRQFGEHPWEGRDPGGRRHDPL